MADSYDGQLNESEKLAEIQAAVEARKTAEAVDIGLQDAPPEVPLFFIRECFEAGDTGDGLLYAVLNRGKYLLDKTGGQWYFWAGHYWKRDLLGARYAGLEVLVEKYSLLLEGAGEDFRTKILRRIRKIHSVSGGENVLTVAGRGEGGLVIQVEQFDRNPWLLACRNGVIELRTGRFRPGRPTDLISKSVPHDCQGIDAPAPLWEKFWNDVFDGDRTLSDFAQRFFGYSVTGLTVLHIFLVLIGEEGRNGKGVLAETLMHTLGPELARPVQAEMLLDQRTARSSSGPSPDIMALKGARLVFASETDKHRRFASSKIKLFSGGDRLSGRNGHDRYETHFEPTHQLILLTNNLPHAEASDRAFWDRLHLLPFNVRFVDDPKTLNERKKDKDLTEKLKGEVSGILAWLVKGCLSWQEQGLNPPPIVRAATEKARVSEDLVSGFIDACAEPPEETSAETRTLLSEAYTAFETWYASYIADSRFCPRKKEWGALMERRFVKKKVAGQLYFYGLALLEQENRN